MASPVAVQCRNVISIMFFSFFCITNDGINHPIPSPPCAPPLHTSSLICSLHDLPLPFDCCSHCASHCHLHGRTLFFLTTYCLWLTLVASLVAPLSSRRCLSHHTPPLSLCLSLVTSLPMLCLLSLWSCCISHCSPSTVVPLPSLRLFSCACHLSCHAAYFIILPLSLRCLSHRSGGLLLHPCLSHCAPASFVTPPLVSRLF